MKIENIYDKHLQAIEEAEERVRVAKLDLKEIKRFFLSGVCCFSKCFVEREI